MARQQFAESGNVMGWHLNGTRRTAEQVVGVKWLHDSRPSFLNQTCFVNMVTILPNRRLPLPRRHLDLIQGRPQQHCVHLPSCNLLGGRDAAFLQPASSLETIPLLPMNMRRWSSPVYP